VAGSDTLTVTVNNLAPTAQIVSVTKPNPLLPKVHTVNFQGSFSDPGINDAPTATWDFGDGSTASGTLVQHVYSAPGTYTVTLTVTDKDGGIGTATTVVKVVTAGEYIDAMKAYIQNLPDSAFKNLPGLRRAALLMELSVVSSLVDHQQYNAAILTLKVVVRPEMDGSLTPNNPRDDRDDWITNAGAQRDMCGMIDDVIAYLRTQM
jgi:PKD repeat protein